MEHIPYDQEDHLIYLLRGKKNPEKAVQIATEIIIDYLKQLQSSSEPSHGDPQV